MQVLHQRALDRAQIVGGSDDGRNDGQAGAPSCSPPALAGDQLVGTGLTGRAHQHRLEHTDLAHRSSELCQRLFIEVHTRLMRVGHDAADGQLLQTRLVAAHHCRCIGGNERTEPFTESAEPRHR